MAAIQLRETDLRRLLTAAGELDSVAPSGPGGITELLTLLETLVRCDSVSWSRLDLTARRALDGAARPGDFTTATSVALIPAFWAHYAEHPLCHGPGADLPVATLSDFMTVKPPRPLVCLRTAD